MMIRKWIVLLAATIIVAGAANSGVSADWDGWYVGGYGGYVSGEVNSNDPSHKETTGDYKDDGFTAGVLGGYRHQSQNNWVLGAEVVMPLHFAKGTAVDKVYFPDQVTYEGRPKFGLLGGIHAGRAFGKVLPYAFGLVGFANAEGKTYNVDLAETYSPGFEQSASAIHLVWEAGIGIDCQLSKRTFLSGRLGAFTAQPANHTMPWNEPGPNEFGYKSVLVRFGFGYRF